MKLLLENWRKYVNEDAGEHPMKEEDWNVIGDILRDSKKAAEIHQLLVGMFPEQKELLDYHYNDGDDSYPELKRFIHGIDKYILEGPVPVNSEDLVLPPDAAEEREMKYQQYIRDKESGKDTLYFRNDPSDPRDVDFSKLPPITIDEKGVVSDGLHRAFLAIKAGSPLQAYKIVFKKNNHPNVGRILQLVGRTK